MAARSRAAGASQTPSDRSGRRRRLVGLVFLVASVLASTKGGAQELVLGVGGDYTFNSNFFSASANPEEANSFQFGPSLGLTDTEGRLQYELTFDGRYQAYADQDGVNAWESRLRARATYDLTTRTRIRITEGFRDISNLRFSRGDIAVADTALDPNQDRYFRNDLDLELIHDLTDLLELRLRGEHHWIDFRQNRDRNDSTTWEAAAELRYQLAVDHFVGTGMSYARQNFDSALSRFGSRAQYVSAFGTWTWLVSDTITISANGGPSWVRSDEEASQLVQQTQFVGGEVNGDVQVAQYGSCGTGAIRFASDCVLGLGSNPAADLGPIQAFPFAPGPQERVRTDSTLTFFGGVSATATLAAWNLQASYQRRQTTTTGDGLASSLDRIAFEIEYAPPRYRWSTFVAGSWDRRESLTDSTRIDFILLDVPDAANAERSLAVLNVQSDDGVRDNFTLIAGFRYNLEQNLASTLDARYRHTQIGNVRPSRPDVDTFFVVLTFEYNLDPIQL